MLAGAYSKISASPAAFWVDSRRTAELALLGWCCCNGGASKTQLNCSHKEHSDGDSVCSPAQGDGTIKFSLLDAQVAVFATLFTL